jgi:hypothetical protein
VLNQFAFGEATVWEQFITATCIDTNVENHAKMCGWMWMRFLCARVLEELDTIVVSVARETFT